MASVAVFRRCLLFIVLAAAAACSLADINFINHSCEKTADKDFCVSMLTPDRRSINASTVVELAIIALDIDSSADIPSTVGLLQQIADKNPGTDLEAALNECISIYSNAGDDLAEARDDVGSKNFSEANSLIENVSGSPDSCSKMFVNVQMPPSVAAKGEWLGKRIDVCADLVQSLLD